MAELFDDFLHSPGIDPQMEEHFRAFLARQRIRCYWPEGFFRGARDRIVSVHIASGHWLAQQDCCRIQDRLQMQA